MEPDQREFFGRIHNDFWNVPRYVVTGVRMPIKLTKTKMNFYLMNKDAESKTVFKFLDVQLLVHRFKATTLTLLVNNATLGSGALGQYNLMRYELKNQVFYRIAICP